MLYPVKIEFKDYPNGSWIDWSQYLVDAPTTNQRVESENEGEAGVIVFDSASVTFRYETGNPVYTAFSIDLTSKQRYVFRISILKSDKTYVQRMEGMADFSSIEWGENEPTISFEIVDKLSALGILSAELSRTEHVMDSRVLQQQPATDHMYYDLPVISPSQEMSISARTQPGDILPLTTPVVFPGEILIDPRSFLNNEDPVYYIVLTSYIDQGTGVNFLTVYPEIEARTENYILIEIGSGGNKYLSKELYGIDINNVVGGVLVNLKGIETIQALYNQAWPGETINRVPANLNFALPPEYAIRMTDENPLGDTPLDALISIVNSVRPSGGEVISGSYFYINKAGNPVIHAKNNLSCGTTRTLGNTRAINRTKKYFWDKLVDGAKVTVESWVTDPETGEYLQGSGFKTLQASGLTGFIKPKNETSKKILAPLQDPPIDTQELLDSCAEGEADNILSFYGKRRSVYSLKLDLDDNTIQWELIDNLTLNSVQYFFTAIETDPISRIVSLEAIETEGHEFDFKQIVVGLSESNSSGYSAGGSSSGGNTGIYSFPYTFTPPLYLTGGALGIKNLEVDRADILAQRSGTTAQEYRIYNTYTDENNNEFVSLGFKNNLNVFTIESGKNGSGTIRNIAVTGGRVGIGTPNPLSLLHIRETDLGVTSDMYCQGPHGYITIEDEDVRLGLFSRNEGGHGSTVLFAEVNSGIYQDQWSLGRLSSGFQSDFQFCYGTDSDYTANIPKLVFTNRGKMIIGDGVYTPKANLHVKAANVSNKHVDQYVGFLLENTEPRLQLIGDDSGNYSTEIILSNAPALGNNKHWILHAAPLGQSNKFEIGYVTSAIDGSNFGGAAFAVKPLTLLTDGKVGINTSSPGTPLHISHLSDSAIDDVLTLQNLGTTGVGGGAGTAIKFISHSNVTDGRISLVNDVAGKTSLRFSTYHNAALSEDVAIQGGNVGIATTSPEEKLDVNGNIRFNGYLGSADYLSQLTGLRITSAGSGDFRYIYTDELHAKAFIADLEQALAGAQIICKSVAKVSGNFTTPTAGNSARLVVESFAGFETAAVFQNGDLVRLRQFSRTSGSLDIADAWGTAVLDTTFGSYGFNTAAKTQAYTFTRHATVPGSASGTIKDGTLALDYGVSGNGFVESNAIDGAWGANSPYNQIVTWSITPGNYTIHNRAGKLTGITDNDFGGSLPSAFGTYINGTAFIKGNIFVKAANQLALQHASIMIGNISGTAFNAIKIAQTGTTGTSGIFLYDNNGNELLKFALDGNRHIANWNFAKDHFYKGDSSTALVLNSSATNFINQTTGVGFEVYDPANPKVFIGDWAGNHLDWSITNPDKLTVTGEIIGSIITGGIIQTDVPGIYPRIVINEDDSNTIKFYSATDKVLTMEPEFYGEGAGVSIGKGYLHSYLEAKSAHFDYDLISIYDGTILGGVKQNIFQAGILTIEDTKENTSLDFNCDGTISSMADIKVNPAGKYILPTNNFDIYLGSANKKFLALNAAELWVDTLVAQNVMATIGGRIIIAPSNSLNLDCHADHTFISVNYNNLNDGDVVYLEGMGYTEFMLITSAVYIIDGKYRYNVQRDLVGTGAIGWWAGQGIVSTGQTGSGFIDIYSIRGVKSSNEAGPTIVGNVRNSATYNDWSEAWAIGNLGGLYGQSSGTFGVGLGKYANSNSFMVITPANGIQFKKRAAGTDTTIAQWAADGTINIGNTTGAHTLIDANGIKLKSGSSVRIQLNNDGSGLLGNGDIQWNASGSLSIAGVLYVGNAAYDINNNSTTINGSKITTGTITTSHLNFTPIQTGNVVASINASAEGIRINAAKLEINGNCTFASGYNPFEKTSSGDVIDIISVTTIDGNNIETGTITANKIKAGELVVGTNVGLGTAVNSSGVTTIIGNTVTTGFVNALNVTAGSVAAENITGTYITGKTIKTAVTGQRVIIDGAYNEIRFFDIEGNNASLWGDHNLDGYGIIASDGILHSNVGLSSAGDCCINELIYLRGNILGAYPQKAIDINPTASYSNVGITIGSDTNIYRGGANLLKTDDAFDAASIKINGTEIITSGRVLQNVSLPSHTHNSFRIENIGPNNPTGGMDGDVLKNSYNGSVYIKLSGTWCQIA